MIDLGRAAFHAEGVTLLPDHAESSRFHYLPDRPELRVTPDGLPELLLVKYRLDPDLNRELGAGLLSFTVDLAVDEERLKHLRRRIATQVGGGDSVQLAPISAEAGRCELVLIDRSSAPEAAGGPADSHAAGFGLVEKIYGAAAPALYGSKAATFQAVLSAEAVALVEGALRSGGLPIGVVYALETLGIRPALRAEIVAHWHEVYGFYENRLHGGKLLLATDIGKTLEELIEQQAITINIDELVPEPERLETYRRALDQVQRYVLEELFKPSLGQAPPPEGENDSALATIGRAIKDIAGFFSLTYSLRETERRELKSLRYHLGVARAERLTLAPQGTLALLLGAEPPAAQQIERLIIAVEPAASAEMKFDIGAAIDLSEEEIDHVEVLVTYGDRLESLVLDAANPRREIRVWYQAALGPAIAYSYEVHARPGGANFSDRLRSETRMTDRRIIRLNPRELYQRLAIRAVAQGIPFDRYPLVLIDLRAHNPIDGWSKAETLELTSNHPEASFDLRASLGVPVRFERRLRFIDIQGQTTTSPWEAIEPGVMIVGDPYPEVIDVHILASARFEEVIKRLIVELRPRAEPLQIATRVLTAEQPSANWSMAVRADAERGYDYRVSVHTMLNEVREGEWLAGPPGKLIVGEGIFRIRQVEMLCVGPSFKDLGLLALKIRFAFEDGESGLFAENEMLVEDPKKPIRWSYPVADPARQTYTYQLTYIRNDGRVEPQPPVATTDLLVVQALL
ncbi:MAG: hypothetical protein ACREV1_00320 [Gammaproteobacteria bacterium]